MSDYTFLTSCYIKSDIEEFELAMLSMLNQTLPPEQIVVVCDGEISEGLSNLINSFAENNENLFTIVRLEKNQGLGIALREGTSYCRNDIIVRMDMDDICISERCEKQIKYLDEHSDIDVVGSNIEEFIENEDCCEDIRAVPETHEEICKYMKLRTPFNHMTVAMRKSALEKAGGYEHWWLHEDLYLWVRMYLAGCKFYNIQENLVHVRVGKAMCARRGGYKYYKSEKGLYKFMYKNKVISWGEFHKAKLIRFVVHVLMPNGLRQWFYKRFARRKKSEN